MYINLRVSSRDDIFIGAIKGNTDPLYYVDTQTH